MPESRGRRKPAAKREVRRNPAAELRSSPLGLGRIVPEEDRIRLVMEGLSPRRQGAIAVDYTRHLELNDAEALGMTEDQRLAMIAELEPYLSDYVKMIIAEHNAVHPGDGH